MLCSCCTGASRHSSSRGIVRSALKPLRFSHPARIAAARLACVDSLPHVHLGSWLTRDLVNPPHARRLQQDVSADRLRRPAPLRDYLNHTCMWYAFKLQHVVHASLTNDVLCADDCMLTENPEKCTHKMAEYDLWTRTLERLIFKQTVIGHVVLFVCFCAGCRDGFLPRKWRSSDRSWYAWCS